MREREETVHESRAGWQIRGTNMGVGFNFIFMVKLLWNLVAQFFP